MRNRIIEYFMVLLFFVVLIVIVSNLLIKDSITEVSKEIKNGTRKTDNTEVYVNETERKLFEIDEKLGELGITRERFLLIEELIKEKYPEIFENAELSSVNYDESRPYLLLIYYDSKNIDIDNNRAIVAIDLEKGDTIIAVKSPWGEPTVYNPRCCYGINFYNNLFAESAGYGNCTLGECTAPPTTEEIKQWICPNDIEIMNCMPVYPPSMMPYCGTIYGEWVGKNCGIGTVS